MTVMAVLVQVRNPLFPSHPRVRTEHVSES